MTRGSRLARHGWEISSEDSRLRIRPRHYIRHSAENIDASVACRMPSWEMPLDVAAVLSMFLIDTSTMMQRFSLGIQSCLVVDVQPVRDAAEVDEHRVR